MEQPTSTVVARTGAPLQPGQVRSDLWVYEPKIRLWLQAGEIGVLTHQGLLDVFPRAQVVADPRIDALHATITELKRDDDATIDGALGAIEDVLTGARP